MNTNSARVTAQFLPATTVVADAPGQWTIRILIAAEIKRLGGVRVYVPPGWTVPQLDGPAKEGHVTVLCRTSARTRTFLHTWRWITIQVEDGSLIPGDVIEVVYGGPLGARPPRVSDEVTEFTILLDPNGLGNYDAQPGSPQVRTIPGPPIGLEVTTPSIVTPGERVPILVKAVDALGNAVPSPLDLELSLVTGEAKAETGKTEARTDGSPARLSLSIPSEGASRIRVRDRRQSIEGLSPAVVAHPAPHTKLFWGDIHGHSAASDGALSPEEYYRFARDVSGLDFCSLSDHDDVGHNSNVPDHSRFMTPDVWKELQGVTNTFNAPGKFATLVGYEYSQIELGIEGHRNVYYRADSGPLLHARDPKCNTPTKLFRCLEGITALVIPHHPLHYMSGEHDPRVQRLVEVYSMWGTSEDASSDCAFTGKMVSPGSGLSWQAYLSRGYRLGVTAGGDNHDSRPGRRGATDRWRKGRMAQRPGLLAVYALELTREHVFDALWARRCYATTGQRIFLDFRINGHWMGEEVIVRSHEVPRHVSLWVLGESDLESVELLMNNEVVAAWTPSGNELRIEWEDATQLHESSFYYARVREKDGGRAWSSPIWFDTVLAG